MTSVKIDAFSFGRMVINGREYLSDLLIHPDGRITDDWRRKSGHRLTADDILDLVQSSPDVIIAGTGVSGEVRPEEDLAAVLSRRRIEFIAAPNREAVDRYNALSSMKRVGACFHLTC